MIEIKKTFWEESYGRNENFMLYPKEEVVKFINRFIRKRVSLTEYVNILQSDDKLKALDFGCGIGRITILLHEFNVEAYGIDISENAIDEAKKLAKYFQFNLNDNFSSYNGKKIPFKDEEFDFTISEAVLDSLPFELAKQLMKEIDRVTKKYFFMSLMHSNSASLFSTLEDAQEFNGEIEVKEMHEHGTVVV